MQLGAVEINKNCIICATGNDSGEIMSTTAFDLVTPKESIDIIENYFKSKHIKALGVAIYETLNPQWNEFNFYNSIKNVFKCEIAVNRYAEAAVLGELNFGSCKGMSNCIYMTSDNIVETGVIKDGKLIDSPVQIESEDEVQNLAGTIDNAIKKYSPQRVVIQSASNDNNMLDLIRKYISAVNSNIDNIDEYIVMPECTNPALKGMLSVLRKMV